MAYSGKNLDNFLELLLSDMCIQFSLYFVERALRLTRLHSLRRGVRSGLDEKYLDREESSAVSSTSLQ